MGEANAPDAGALIRRYREARTLRSSKAAVAREVGLDPSYMSRLENGRRPISLELAEKIADALVFSPEDREALLRAPQVKDAEALDDHYLHELERRWYATTRDAFLRVSKRLPYRAAFVSRWFVGRVHVARFDVKRAVPLLEAVVREVEAVDEVPGELRVIVLLDLADAYAIAGRLREAEDQAIRSERVGRALLREQPASARANMGVARALVMLQEIAYERGDETACWSRHEEALPFLRQATDHYGWSKSLFFLGLFRFWQGDFAAAEAYAREAREHAGEIRSHFDPWWALRDAFFLASHWWHVHTESLLLDVLAAAGHGGSPEFDLLLLSHRGGRLSWTPDFPPFTPRYWWADQSVAVDVAQVAEDFKRWVATTKRRGCMHLHTDILLAQGDFFRIAGRDEARARGIYQQAHRIASDPKHGYRLFVLAARTRLQGALPFPGLSLDARH